MLPANSKINRPGYKFSKYFRYKRAFKLVLVLVLESKGLCSFSWVHNILTTGDHAYRCKWKNMKSSCIIISIDITKPYSILYSFITLQSGI